MLPEKYGEKKLWYTIHASSPARKSLSPNHNCYPGLWLLSSWFFLELTWSHRLWRREANRGRNNQQLFRSSWQPLSPCGIFSPFQKHFIKLFLENILKRQSTLKEPCLFPCFSCFWFLMLFSLMLFSLSLISISLISISLFFVFHIYIKVVYSKGNRRR